jgi:hypothetical protein
MGEEEEGGGGGICLRLRPHSICEGTSTWACTLTKPSHYALCQPHSTN